MSKLLETISQKMAYFIEDVVWTLKGKNKSVTVYKQIRVDSNIFIDDAGRRFTQDANGNLH